MTDQPQPKKPQEIDVPEKGVAYMGFGYSYPFEKAVERFQQKYNQFPKCYCYYKSLLWIGPEPKGQTS